MQTDQRAALHGYLAAMPKVELHVHLEGSMPPETLLKLANKHGVPLPADDVEGLRRWFEFRDFPHFIEIYNAISDSLRTPEDIEALTRAVLEDRARQNILHTEATYTAYSQFARCGVPLDEQLEAINSARAWAEREYGITLNLVIDISRDSSTLEQALIVADWAATNHGNGISALGLGGYEVGFPPEMFTAAFDHARSRGLPAVVHAGETEGPASVWGAMNTLQAVRIGHGVRCLEDPALVEVLRERQIPLEVSPTSNVCLRVFPRYEDHPLTQLLDEGLYVTLNSDDPPLFNVTLIEEYQKAADVFGLSVDRLEQFSRDAAQVALLPADRKQALITRLEDESRRLRAEYGL